MHSQRMKKLGRIFGPGNITMFSCLLVLTCSCSATKYNDADRQEPDEYVIDETRDADDWADTTVNDETTAENEFHESNNEREPVAVLGDECANWQTQHPEWLWCDDFEDAASLQDKYPDTGLNGMSVTSSDAFSGTHSLEQHYGEGQVDAGWLSFFYGDTLGNDYGQVQKDIYMRWYHKFEQGFEGFPPKMARITSIGPGWDKRFGVHFWIDQGEVVADVHAPFSSQANDAGWLPIRRSGFFFTDQGNVGRWICFEMYVRANSPGLSDGAYMFWADGKKIIDAQGVDLVGDTDYHFNNAMLDCYWNGGSPKPQNRYYDSFVVSTKRIGCRQP